MKDSAELHNGVRLLAITSEAMYHSPCYKKYTRIYYQKKSNDQVASQSMAITKELALPSIMEHLIMLHHQPDVVSFSFFTDLMAASLSENEGIDKKEVESARENLRRTIEECYSDEFHF